MGASASSLSDQYIVHEAASNDSPLLFSSTSRQPKRLSAAERVRSWGFIECSLDIRKAMDESEKATPNSPSSRPLHPLLARRFGINIPTSLSPHGTDKTRIDVHCVNEQGATDGGQRGGKKGVEGAGIATEDEGAIDLSNRGLDGAAGDGVLVNRLLMHRYAYLCRRQQEQHRLLSSSQAPPPHHPLLVPNLSLHQSSSSPLHHTNNNNNNNSITNNMDTILPSITTATAGETYPSSSSSSSPSAVAFDINGVDNEAAAMPATDTCCIERREGELDGDEGKEGAVHPLFPPPPREGAVHTTGNSASSSPPLSSPLPMVSLSLISHAVTSLSLAGNPSFGPSGLRSLLTDPAASSASSVAWWTSADAGALVTPNAPPFAVLPSPEPTCSSGAANNININNNNNYSSNISKSSPSLSTPQLSHHHLIRIRRRRVVDNAYVSNTHINNSNAIGNTTAAAVSGATGDTVGGADETAGPNGMSQPPLLPIPKEEGSSSATLTSPPSFGTPNLLLRRCAFTPYAVTRRIQQQRKGSTLFEAQNTPNNRQVTGRECELMSSHRPKAARKKNGAVPAQMRMLMDNTKRGGVIGGKRYSQDDITSSSRNTTAHIMMRLRNVMFPHASVPPPPPLTVLFSASSYSLERPPRGMPPFGGIATFLRSLDLSGCGIGDEGAKLVAERIIAPHRSSSSMHRSEINRGLFDLFGVTAGALSSSSIVNSSGTWEEARRRWGDGTRGWLGLMKGAIKGKPKQKRPCPVVTKDGFTDIGKTAGDDDNNDGGVDTIIDDTDLQVHCPDGPTPQAFQLVCPHLEELYLDNNNISDKGFERIGTQLLLCLREAYVRYVAVRDYCMDMHVTTRDGNENRNGNGGGEEEEKESDEELADPHQVTCTRSMPVGTKQNDNAFSAPVSLPSLSSTPLSPTTHYMVYCPYSESRNEKTQDEGPTDRIGREQQKTTTMPMTTMSCMITIPATPSPHRQVEIHHDMKTGESEGANAAMVDSIMRVHADEPHESPPDSADLDDYNARHLCCGPPSSSASSIFCSPFFPLRKLSLRHNYISDESSVLIGELMAFTRWAEGCCMCKSTNTTRCVHDRRRGEEGEEICHLIRDHDGHNALCLYEPSCIGLGVLDLEGNCIGNDGVALMADEVAARVTPKVPYVVAGERRDEAYASHSGKGHEHQEMPEGNAPSQEREGSVHSKSLVSKLTVLTRGIASALLGTRWSSSSLSSSVPAEAKEENREKVLAEEDEDRINALFLGISSGCDGDSISLNNTNCPNGEGIDPATEIDGLETRKDPSRQLFPRFTSSCAHRDTERYVKYASTRQGRLSSRRLTELLGEGSIATGSELLTRTLTHSRKENDIVARSSKLQRISSARASACDRVSRCSDGQLLGARATVEMKERASTAQRGQSTGTGTCRCTCASGIAEKPTPEKGRAVTLLSSSFSFPTVEMCYCTAFRDEYELLLGATSIDHRGVRELMRAFVERHEEAMADYLETLESVDTSLERLILRTERVWVTLPALLFHQGESDCMLSSRTKDSDALPAEDGEEKEKRRREQLEYFRVSLQFLRQRRGFLLDNVLDLCGEVEERSAGHPLHSLYVRTCSTAWQSISPPSPYRKLCTPKAFPPSFSFASNLRRMDLSYNPIGDEGAVHLLAVICGFKEASSLLALCAEAVVSKLRQAENIAAERSGVMISQSDLLASCEPTTGTLEGTKAASWHRAFPHAFGTLEDLSLAHCGITSYSVEAFVAALSDGQCLTSDGFCTAEEQGKWGPQPPQHPSSRSMGTCTEDDEPLEAPEERSVFGKTCIRSLSPSRTVNGIGEGCRLVDLGSTLHSSPSRNGAAAFLAKTVSVLQGIEEGKERADHTYVSMSSRHAKGGAGGEDSADAKCSKLSRKPPKRDNSSTVNARSRRGASDRCACALPHLKHLNLSGNHFGGAGGKVLSSFVSHAATLVTNHDTEKGAYNTRRDDKKSMHCEEFTLNISNCSIGGEGVRLAGANITKELRVLATTCTTIGKPNQRSTSVEWREPLSPFPLLVIDLANNRIDRYSLTCLRSAMQGGVRSELGRERGEQRKGSKSNSSSVILSFLSSVSCFVEGNFLLGMERSGRDDAAGPSRRVDWKSLSFSEEARAGELNEDAQEGRGGRPADTTAPNTSSGKSRPLSPCFPSPVAQSSSPSSHRRAPLAALNVNSSASGRGKKDTFESKLTCCKVPPVAFSSSPPRAGAFDQLDSQSGRFSSAAVCDVCMCAPYGLEDDDCNRAGGGGAMSAAPRFSSTLLSLTATVASSNGRNSSASPPLRNSRYMLPYAKTAHAPDRGGSSLLASRAGSETFYNTKHSPNSPLPPHSLRRSEGRPPLPTARADTPYNAKFTFGPKGLHCGDSDISLALNASPTKGTHQYLPHGQKMHAFELHDHQNDDDDDDDDGDLAKLFDEILTRQARGDRHDSPKQSTFLRNSSGGARDSEDLASLLASLSQR